MKRLTAFIIMLVLCTSLLSPAAYAAGKVSSAKSRNIYDSGDCVSFGRYEQDGFKKNGAEELSWTVLDTHDDYCLLLCDNCIETMPFDSDGKSVDWEDSDIREWLNDDFLAAAFNDDELDKILIAENKYTCYSKNKLRTCTTEDLVFLLSVDEVEEYFTGNVSKRAVPTDYCIDNGIKQEYKIYSYWWLRDAGKESNRACGVHAEGGINYDGRVMSREGLGVRPAIWVDFGN